MAARPQLRGFLASNLKRDFTLAITVALTGLLSYKFLVQEPRKRRYEEYYKNLDPEKEFRRIRDAGGFQCVKPGGEVQDGCVEFLSPVPAL
ncbi:hypothetical protein LSH36_316g08061 [Paralvinella palmiformis]|uniref:Mitochondrial cytochrome c oxidase subunit VIc/VIIs domain-containing protein n=1 Tax=Paralvinella palmiformis TaxID=53620 RepID=A0AAD9JGR9_9ANNE|nr:hypothetical protein LSH36_316g08061 [Paralvinella palmiformis]